MVLANALWARDDVAFGQPFIDTNRNSFGAQVSTLDFEQDDVADAINSWVSNATKGMIRGFVTAVPPQAVIYLANAVYFKGDWTQPFTHEGTSKEQFVRSDGSGVEVEMMRSARTLPYAQDESMQATKLTYKGSDTAFYILLPRRDVGVDSLLRDLGDGRFARLAESLTSESATAVVLGLPKLDSKLATSLAAPLASMGMPRAFDSGGAEFSGITGESPVWIADILHATRIKVDEKGTEAAAATMVGIIGAAIPPALPREMICDRPYVFAIVDEHSGAALFIGLVNDPTR